MSCSSSGEIATATGTLSGYLLKRGARNTHSWRHRYFELQNKHLLYYKAKGARLLGRINLNKARVRMAAEPAPRPNCFGENETGFFDFEP